MTVLFVQIYGIFFSFFKWIIMMKFNVKPLLLSSLGLVHFKHFRSFKIYPFGFLPSINFSPKILYLMLLLLLCVAHIFKLLTGYDNINRWNLCEMTTTRNKKHIKSFHRINITFSSHPKEQCRCYCY